MTDKLPVVDMAKWGDRIIGSADFVNAESMPMTGEAFQQLVEQLDIADQPCGIVVDAQTLGRLWADKCSPAEFNQFLFMQLKAAGCSAVEGTLKMKLNRGKVFKIKSVPGEMEFRYMWLAPVLCAALGVAGDDKIGLVM